MKKKKIMLIAYLLLMTVFIVQRCYAQAPTLWGMTPAGGQFNLGTIFSYELNTNSYAIQYNFDSLSGISPCGSLIQANNGYLYGMTYAGGTYNGGTIFSYNTTTGVYNVLHNFGNTSDSDGKAPQGTLFQADNGLLYGMTRYGTYNTGIIFSYNITTGEYSRVHKFLINTTDGIAPVGPVMQASNGLLYGMTANGGTGGGIIFNYNTTTGSYKVVHRFSNHATDGSSPFGTLVQANDSVLLGLTFSGGVNNGGTIFSYNMYTDSEALVHSFSTFLKGHTPIGSLLKANNGLFYGTVLFGGRDSAGIIFNYDMTADTVGDIHNFGSNLDGVNPYGSLIQATNGLLYGTTEFGGDYDSGTLFSYNIANGTEIIVHSFSGRNDGFFQIADVIEVDFPTTIKQVVADNLLQIWPNPTVNKLTGSLNFIPQKTTGQIIAPDGRVLMENIIIQKKTFEIDVSNLPAGLYFLEVLNESERVVKKFVKR